MSEFDVTKSGTQSELNSLSSQIEREILFIDSSSLPITGVS